eukprot:IDg23071t1
MEGDTNRPFPSMPGCCGINMNANISNVVGSPLDHLSQEPYCTSSLQHLHLPAWPPTLNYDIQKKPARKPSPTTLISQQLLLRQKRSLNSFQLEVEDTYNKEATSQ